MAAFRTRLNYDIINVGCVVVRDGASLADLRFSLCDDDRRFGQGGDAVTRPPQPGCGGAKGGRNPLGVEGASDDCEDLLGHSHGVPGTGFWKIDQR